MKILILRLMWFVFPLMLVAALAGCASTDNPIQPPAAAADTQAPVAEVVEEAPAQAAQPQPAPQAAAAVTPAPQDSSVRDDFYQGEMNSTPARPAPVALKYQVMVKDLDGDIRKVTDRYRFSTGESIRLVFESNVDGYLYIFMKGASSRGARIFPDPRLDGGNNHIRRHRQYAIPPAGGQDAGWWKFDKNVGTEELYVFLSPEPIKDLGALPPGAPGGEMDERGWKRVETQIRSADAKSLRDLFYEAPAQDAAAQPTAVYVASPPPVLIHTIRLQHGY